ncbi:isoprenyl transferase [Dysgonomonas sp. 216]|uniref:isoprenyl transferase n=1 Tax=Dysgonomonas sp. 216 TaxID=2302934 RepID=UPI0013D7D0BA|nr:isoprenyl transferase [Dysgonomonas sp. 216]NDW19854.1 isoprenyl transferase [Dysgonomonas sp. 216]
MSFREHINIDTLPQHIAIIMDGNGRWAKQRGHDRTVGHQEGAVSVRKITEAAVALNLSYLTLYTFSTENWNRPQEEVDRLMALLIEFIALETPTMLKNNVRLKVIGDIGRLPDSTLKALNGCLDKTAACTGLTIVLALSYSSRWEIVEACKKIGKAVAEGNISDVDSINEDTVTKYLETNDMPDPDLMIRTGGEKRISNFLLWQVAYSELYFTDTLWPDFREESLYEAIVDYQNRERRFGKTSEQITNKQQK